MSDAILLIDDDAGVLRSLGGYLEQQGFEVARELDGAAGLAACDRLEPDVVVLDHGVAAVEGQDVLGMLRQRGMAVILLLEAPDEEVTLRALHRGADRVLVRPSDPAVVAAAAARVADATRVRRAEEALLAVTGTAGRLESLGQSAPMRAVAQQVASLAQSDRTTVLLLGEPGVGKGWVARLIHDVGPRTREPFLEGSCVGIGPVALESRLFGHERGAVLDARRRQRGLLELAGRGTVLLREIAALPAELQPGLLKVLESRAFRRVGGQRDVTANARLIVTSSRDLAAEVEADAFRGDLYYRLSTMVLAIPPVRDRSENDRMGLVEATMARLAADLPEPAPPISPEAMERLVAYAWPGNVREMRNVLERAILLARGQLAIMVEHLAGELRARPGLGDRRHTPMSIDELERLHIDRTLRFHGGNRTRAAKELRISRATLINKIKRYNITD
jgi:DNA-binding NtrC family response regulator